MATNIDAAHRNLKFLKLVVPTGSDEGVGFLEFLKKLMRYFVENASDLDNCGWDIVMQACCGKFFLSTLLESIKSNSSLQLFIAGLVGMD
jgi:hypothetical protein